MIGHAEDGLGAADPLRSGWPEGTEAAGQDRDGLWTAYQLYRERQARDLVSMMPREAVRPMYRAAHAALARTAVGDGVDATARAEDPLDVLVRFCARLLPLPPFAVWLADLRAHPGAHLAEWAEGAGGPPATAPVTLATRGFEAGGRSWQARLRSYHETGAWRGFIAFERAEWADRGDGADRSPASRAVAVDAYRTAAVFRESDPETLRTRFEEFDGRALAAFLRSCLP